MSPKRFLSIFIVLTCLFGNSLPLSAFPQKSIEKSLNVLDSIKTAFLDSNGVKLDVEWDYLVNGDEWKGKGTLKILGNKYLKLSFPEQVILIKKSVIMSYYRETDQVIMDAFDRTDPTNIFSILMGNYSSFYLESVRRTDKRIRQIELGSNSLVGFDQFEITLDQDSLIPRTIMAQSGKDIKLKITINGQSPLINRDELINAQLTGEEIIDLRE